MDEIHYTGHKYGVNLPVGDIKVDLAVQRATVASRLRKIADQWNPDFLGELLVSLREDGGYFVLDGQHRWNIAVEKGLTHLACEVFEGLPKADEARLFIGRNDRAGISWADKDRNLYTMGEEFTLDIQAAAEAAGFVFISDSAEQSTFRDRSAAISIMRDARRKWVADNGPSHLQHTFEFYGRIWGVDERPVSSVLRAVSKALVSKSAWNGDLDQKRLETTLQGLPAQEVESMGARHRQEQQLGRNISLVTAVVEVIQEQYNRGLSTGRRVFFR